MQCARTVLYCHLWPVRLCQNFSPHHLKTGEDFWIKCYLTLTLLTWRIWWALLENASKCRWNLIRRLTFRRRSFFFNFSTPAHKMWIIQEPSKLQLWNKLHFEERKRRVYTKVKRLAPELFFLILAHPVYKMWIIHEPNTLELWNKRHFEEGKTESIHHV